MSLDVVIRKASLEDCTEISKVLELAFIEFQDRYTEKAFDETVIDPDKVATRMEEAVVWVALIDTKIVGTITVKPLADSLYIQGMAVNPDQRGHKIGLKLLQTIEDFAKNNQKLYLLLSTTPYLKRAIKLYERFGFKIINDGPYHLFETPLFTMRKIIV